ncbi:Gfo/Idh/MocA family oxidoreductase [Paenibacillus sp. FSL M8-0142]|uniref:Gfo/Idh/MocA family protein n=1 Tax=Paenibacillus sp. FSL M8-0142 TaxID=2954525 RepID=UPI00315AF8AC
MTLRIGVIGLGGISGAHIAGILASPDAEVWAICDSSEEALQAKGDQLGVPESRRYLHHEALLADPNVDAVTIGTPNHNHYTIAYAAIKHRKPFALEKPVALDTREAAMLKDLLLQDELPHMICFSYRYKAAVRYAKFLIEQGKLGAIRHVYSQYLQSWAIPEQLPLVWRFRKAFSGSGALGDLGSHILDMERFLVGDVERVFSDAGTIIRQRELPEGGGQGPVDVDDYCHVLARMEGGISSTMTISRFAYGRGNYQQLEIYGEKGALVYNLEEADSLYVNLADEGDTGFRKVNIPREYQADQMQAFFNVVNGKGDGLDATMTDGYINQRTIDAIIQSFTEERWIPITKEVSAIG